MATETAKKPPVSTPATVMTSAMTMRLAMKASEFFRAAVSPGMFCWSHFPESSAGLT